MENRKKNIIAWLIIWGGLLLVILYSPIGSPDLYTAKKYYVPDQGVQFTGGEIANAPTLKHRIRSTYQETNVPDFNSLELNNTSYPVIVPENSFNSKPLDISSPGFIPPISTQKITGSGSGIGGGMLTFTGKSTKQTSTTPANGFMALNTTLNGLPGNTLFKANEGTAQDPGGPDPGGGPTGDPIPVGDSWGLFILFGMCYSLLKRWIG